MYALLRRVLIIDALIIAVFVAPLAYGQRRGATPDEQIVREAQLVASGVRVDLFQHGVVVDPALVKAAEAALTRMEELLGQKLDESTFGPRVRIYVAAATTVSHVWRGYEHPKDPRAVLFLNPRVAQLALRGTNATYAHELAHLLTWRYTSHTLREGLADYLALQVHPGAGIGPNSVTGSSPPVPAQVEELLGTTRAPPEAVTSDLQYRRAYYFASYRFVRFLIERAGMATFLKLYHASDTENEFMPLYGVNRKELVSAAMR